MLDSPYASRLDDILAAHRGVEGALLPILHDVQAAFGFVPQEVLPVIARHLNISRAEVHGVVSFYHDFRDAPAGRHVVKLCRAEACQAVGGTALANAVMAAIGCDWHQTAGDVTVDPVFCLGLCACGPAAMVDGVLIGRATPDKVLAKVRA
jgi:formate dehydrogenase subunit gamma